jgi:hypothetical protein
MPIRSDGKPLECQKSRRGSWSSDEGSHPDHKNCKSSSATLDPPILVYHESARSIVFRDHLRRAVRRSESSRSDSAGIEPTVPSAVVAQTPSNQAANKKMDHISQCHTNLDPLTAFVENVEEEFGLKEAVIPAKTTIPPTEQIIGFLPKIKPLPPMLLGPNDQFGLLLNAPDGLTNPAPDDWTADEREVVELLRTQHACVKTLKNADWTPFLRRFCFPLPTRGTKPKSHDDIPPDEEHPFNSFVTSTTMLPSLGLKMRAYGSSTQYTTGVVFAMPRVFPDDDTEDEAQARTETWSWPAGYSAKTEFNIDSRGRLMNGRQEALRPFSVLREYNNDYITKSEYMISTRMVSGLSVIPYNEIFIRVGGFGRIVNNKDVASGKDCSEGGGIGRSFCRGIGLPIALFVRTATYGHLISLLRTRSRIVHAFGEHHVKGIPLLLIDPDHGVRVLTENMQLELWKIASTNLNPFQNPAIAYKTTLENTEHVSFQQKVDELIDLDESIQDKLTPGELAHLAGGFGATDESVANILKRVMMEDRRKNKKGEKEESHKLQDVVNEGLTSAVRSGDYHTSRQLLILYSLVACRAGQIIDEDDETSEDSETEKGECNTNWVGARGRQSSMGNDVDIMRRDIELVSKAKNGTELSSGILAPPPPPPLDTDRLRSATNSDGLLAVLGAAQVLKSMQDGSAKHRTLEAVSAIEEWVTYGEQNMAFRISSWYDQRAAQGDLKIATEDKTSFLAFVSNKAITNRKSFAQKLRSAVSSTDFTDIHFLRGIYEILGHMHSPCLRLELLQYVLGLDNRYSVAHVARSVELAATCLGISMEHS